MNPAEILTWIQVGTILVNSGISTAHGVSSLIKSNSNATDAELNTILDGIILNATKHKNLADKDAGG